MDSRIGRCILVYFALICISPVTNATIPKDDIVSPGHGVRVFLGYFSDYKSDSTQSKFVEEALTSFGVQSSDLSEIIAYFRNLQLEVDADIEAGTVRILCSDLAYRLHGLDLQPVFNSFLDFADATYAQHSAIASADLAGLGYPDLVDRLSQDAMFTRSLGVRFERSGNEGAEYFERERTKTCESLNALSRPGT